MFALLDPNGNQILSQPPSSGQATPNPVSRTGIFHLLILKIGGTPRVGGKCPNCAQPGRYILSFAENSCTWIRTYPHKHTRTDGGLNQGTMVHHQGRLFLFGGFGGDCYSPKLWSIDPSMPCSKRQGWSKGRMHGSLQAWSKMFVVLVAKS